MQRPWDGDMEYSRSPFSPQLGCLPRWLLQLTMSRGHLVSPMCPGCLLSKTQGSVLSSLQMTPPSIPTLPGPRPAR